MDTRARYLTQCQASLTLEELATQFDDFLVEAYRLKLLYASQIQLLVGLETDYITPIDLDQLRDLLDRHRGRVDYLVGSVHHVNGIPIDFDLPTFQKAVESIDCTPEHTTKEGGFLSAYFDAQYELLQRFHPEIVGHFDLCRLYNPDLQLSKYPEAWDRVKRNILFAIDYGAFFEVNASALRKNWTTPYPGEDVLEVQHPPAFPLHHKSLPLHAGTDHPEERGSSDVVRRQSRTSCRWPQLRTAPGISATCCRQ